MTETHNIPLNKLILWDGNVRRTGADDGIEELAASIEAHGLLQALIVRKASRVSSAQIVAALCEAKGVPAAPAWSRMKKAELAVLAAREIAGTRWLPEVLRAPGDTVEEAA